MRNYFKILLALLTILLVSGVFLIKTDIEFSLKSLLASSESLFSSPETVGKDGFGNSLALNSKEKAAASFIEEKQGLIFALKTGANWQKESAALDALAGNQTSLAFDRNGNPNILYIDKDFSLRLAAKDGRGWKNEKIFDNSALSCNLIFDKNNTAHISFWETSKGALVYGKKEGNDWKIEIIDAGKVGWWNSLAVDQNNLPHISYYDFGNKDLLYVFFDGRSWQKEIVDSEGDVGQNNVLTLDSNNQPHILHFDNTNSRLKYAKKGDGGWEIEALNTKNITSDNASIALDRNQKPIILYFDITDKNLKLAKKINDDWHFQNLFLPGWEEGKSSLISDADGNLHLLFQSLNYDQKELKYSILPSY